MPSKSSITSEYSTIEPMGTEMKKSVPKEKKEKRTKKIQEQE